MRVDLVEKRNARHQAEHHLALLKARVTKLATEEERASKTAYMSTLRAREVMRLREAAEERKRLKEHETQRHLNKNSAPHHLDAQERDAIRRAKCKGLVLQKQKLAQQVKQERTEMQAQSQRAKAEWIAHARSLRHKVIDGSEERKRQKQADIALKKKLQAEEMVREKLAREDAEKDRLGREIAKMQAHEAAMLARLKHAQAKQEQALVLLQQSLV